MPATGDGRAQAAAPRLGATAGMSNNQAAERAFPGVNAPCHAAAAPTTPQSDGHTPIPRPRGMAGAASAVAEPASPAGRPPYRLLVIHNDASDAQLIEELVVDSAAHVELYWARGIEQAAARLAKGRLPGPGRGRVLEPEINCVLLDLAAADQLPEPGWVQPTTSRGLPAEPDTSAGGSADGLDGLRELLRRAPNTAVVVLTDATGAELGAAAVAAGAQDFLIKQETDGPLLARTLRYAVERKRADESQRRLVEAELRGQENARLQRHLLPTPLLNGADLAFTRRYRPGRRRALLGGDFYDAVRTDDGRVHVVIGDVCGHGPDEAALGVALRIAWRTLVFAGLTGEALLTTLQHVLEHERRSEEIFATLCMLVLSPGPSGTGTNAPEQAQLYLAGHPAPLLLGAGHSPQLLPSDQAGPALGLLPCDDGLAVWPPQQIELAPGWSLLLYTDGLIEGRVGSGSRRLGQDGLIDLMGEHHSTGLTRSRLVDTAIADVEELNGGALADDVAVLLLERNPAPLIMG